MNYFIPPYILDGLAREGSADVREAILHSHHTRLKREAADLPNFRIPKEVEGPQPLAAVKISDARGQTGQVGTEVLNDAGTQGDTVESRSESSHVSEAAHNAFKYARAARDVIFDNMGRNGLNGKGGEIQVVVNYGLKFNNAFWDGQRLFLGTGDGRIFNNFASSPEVIAHEMGHGLVQFMSPLIYSGESGALNEHFSDVFGALIQAYIAEGYEYNWLIGDELIGPALEPGQALRNMKEPGTAFNNSVMGRDPQPANYKMRYKGGGDNGGVHINSGIMNRAFYKVVQRLGYFDTLPTNHDTAVNMIKARETALKQAGAIWQEALLNLWPTAQFANAAIAIIDATKLLNEDDALTNDVQGIFSALSIPKGW